MFKYINLDVLFPHPYPGDADWGRAPSSIHAPSPLQGDVVHRQQDPLSEPALQAVEWQREEVGCLGGWGVQFFFVQFDNVELNLSKTMLIKIG